MSRERKRPRGARNGAVKGGSALRPAAAIAQPALPAAGFAARARTLPGQQTDNQADNQTDNQAGHQIAPDALRVQPPHIPDPPMPDRTAQIPTSPFTPHLE